MDTLKAIEALAGHARQEKPPATDVSAHVLARIRDREASSVLPLTLFAAASAVAAAVIVFLAVSAWAASADSLVALFDPLQMVTL